VVQGKLTPQEYDDAMSNAEFIYDLDTKDVKGTSTTW